VGYDVASFLFEKADMKTTQEFLALDSLPKSKFYGVLTDLSNELSNITFVKDTNVNLNFNTRQKRKLVRIK